MVASVTHIMRPQALGVLLACTGPVAGGTLDATLALQSDKVVRGATQSGGDPVAAVDVAWRGATGASWVAGLSSLGRDRQRGEAEFIGGGGWGGNFDEDLAWRIGATRYQTIGEGTRRRPNYWEASASLGWQGRAQLLVALLPAYPGVLASGANGHSTTGFLEATWHQALAPRWAIDAGLGHITYRGLAYAGYDYGNLSLAWRSGPLQVVATRVFSSSASTSAAGSRFLLSLLYTP